MTSSPVPWFRRHPQPVIALLVPALMLLALLPAWLLASAPLAAAEHDAPWPQFRGPDGQGVVVTPGPVPTQWSDQDQVTWKTALPGRGWSSPVVADGAIWMTTAHEMPATAEQAAAVREQFKSHPVGAEMGTVAHVELSLLEVDLATGELRRQLPLLEVANPQSIHGLNSYASPTPIVAEGRVFCHFGAFGTVCVDAASGEILWKRQFEIEHGVGPGSSPLLLKGLLIFACDGMDEQYVVALDAATGEVAWKTDRPPIRSQVGDVRKAFCTPLPITVDGELQVVIPGAQWFVAYDPTTGQEQWRVDHGSGFSNVPRPVFDGKRVFLCTGFGRTELWAVIPGKSGAATAPEVAWKYGRQMPTMPSPVVLDGRIYLVSDKGIATCLATESGELVWRERLPGEYSASPLAINGLLYFFNREGRTTIVSPSETLQVKAESDLEGGIYASPAVVGNDLIIRTESHLYRLSAG